MQAEPMLVGMAVFFHPTAVEFRWTIDYIDQESDVTAQLFGREMIEQLHQQLGEWLETFA